MDHSQDRTKPTLCPQCGTALTRNKSVCDQCMMAPPPYIEPTRAHRRRHRFADPHGSDYEDYSPDEVEFLMAMDAYKRDNRRPFPTWREVLDVLLELGYRK